MIFRVQDGKFQGLPEGGLLSLLLDLRIYLPYTLFYTTKRQRIAAPPASPEKPALHPAL